MHRRTFVVSSFVASVSVNRIAAQIASPPSGQERIEIAPGVALVNPRFISIASGSIPALLAELENTTGTSFDTPVVGLTFYDEESNIVGAHYATPVLPVLEDGGSSPVTGEFYEFDPLNDPWDRVEYMVCGQIGTDYYTQELMEMTAEIEDLVEDARDTQYVAKMAIRNTGSVDLDGIGIYVVFRDSEGIFQGYGWANVDRPIPAGKTYALTVDVGDRAAVPFDPFDRLDGTNYSATIVLTPFAGGYGISC